MTTFEFTAELWRHTGEAAWYFVTLPHDIADDVHEITADSRRGFGSVRVRVTVGDTTWSTSLFPDRAAESYLLPVKRAVRTSERLDEGSTVHVVVAID